MNVKFYQEELLDDSDNPAFPDIFHILEADANSVENYLGYNTEDRAV